MIEGFLYIFFLFQLVPGGWQLCKESVSQRDGSPWPCRWGIKRLGIFPRDTRETWVSASESQIFIQPPCTQHLFRCCKGSLENLGNTLSFGQCVLTVPSHPGRLFLKSGIHGINMDGGRFDSSTLHLCSCYNLRSAVKGIWEDLEDEKGLRSTWVPFRPSKPFNLLFRLPLFIV